MLNKGNNIHSVVRLTSRRLQKVRAIMQHTIWSARWSNNIVTIELDWFLIAVFWLRLSHSW